MTALRTEITQRLTDRVEIMGYEVMPEMQKRFPGAAHVQVGPYEALWFVPKDAGPVTHIDNLVAHSYPKDGHNGRFWLAMLPDAQPEAEAPPTMSRTPNYTASFGLGPQEPTFEVGTAFSLSEDRKLVKMTIPSVALGMPEIVLGFQGLELDETIAHMQALRRELVCDTL